MLITHNHANTRKDQRIVQRLPMTGPAAYSFAERVLPPSRVLAVFSTPSIGRAVLVPTEMKRPRDHSQSDSEHDQNGKEESKACKLDQQPSHGTLSYPG